MFKQKSARLRLYLLTCLGVVLATITQAQILQPVKWQSSNEYLGNNEFTLLFKATVDDGWHIYSQEVGEDGPLPTTFEFANPDVTLVGKIEEVGKAEEGIDPIFETFVRKYKKNVTFKAKVKTKKSEVKLEVPVTYMSCDATKCTKLDETFNFTLKAAGSAPVASLPPTSATSSPNNSKEATSSTPKSAAPPSATTTTTIAPPSKKNEPSTTTATATKSETMVTAPTTNNTLNKPPAGNLGSSNTMSSGGIVDPVSWSFTREDLGQGEYALQLKATLQPGWYIYAQNLPEGGPIPTEIVIEPNPDIELVGKIEEISNHTKKGFDSIFNIEVTKFAEEVVFRQKLRMKNPNAPLSGSVRFMTCDDTRCLPPETVPFTVGSSESSAAAIGESAQGASVKNLIKDCGLNPDELQQKGRSLWLTFILGFLGGFAALLTPCVFPMIPLTVSFFTKRSKDKRKGIINALIYALSIVVIYVSLGLLVTILFGPEVLNKLSTDKWFNLAFFAIFVVFALSFFGFYEITLPSSFVNKVDSVSDRGGLLGIFFMAFTLALVSFSCTGPIIGTLLVEAAVGGERLGPMMGMFGFALALAMPFALFAAFPGWLNSMPRSGGWLNTVKVVLGFVELIFALKFLSNADLVEQWGLLKRETFLVIWILLSVLMALYLIGVINFKSDAPGLKFTPMRSGLAIACVAFAAYLVPGIFCKNLAWVSGFPPPVFYSYGCGTESDGQVHVDTHIRDLSEAVTLAQKEGKPVMIDFTGWACVNCRKMEENVWTKPEIASLINQYTLVSLYVDEKIPLPEGQQFEYELLGKTKKARTVGDKWSYLQTSCFNTNTQPYYALVTPSGEFLNAPLGYTPEVDKYADFLKEGLLNYQKGATVKNN